MFMNSNSSKTSDPHRLLLNLKDKIDLKRKDKHIALSNLSIYYTWKDIKISYKNDKFKILAPTWNEEFELPDGSYSIPDIQDYFEYVLKKHGENIDNLSIRIYVNKTENRITFKIETGYNLELLTPEVMKLLVSTENKAAKDKNGENLPHLEVTEVVIFHFNVVNNDSQQDSRVLFIFVPSKPSASLLEISPTNIFLKTFNSEFQDIEVWFTDQNSQPLEIEDRINLTMVIK